ncbi:MAG: hypothetical protein ACXWT0_04425 [Methylobacter sp.]
MSHCDHCQNELSDYRFYLDRNVQFFSYSGMVDADGIAEHIQATVLYSENVNHFCSASCSDASVAQILHSLGLKLLPPGIGPVETCAKCNGPVDMTAPHVAYSLLEATRVSKPWLTQLKVHNHAFLCVVCPKCDGNLMESEWQVASEDEAAPLESANLEVKETARS